MTARPKFLRFEAAVLAALFATAIGLPLVKQNMFGEPDTSATEKRMPAQWPDFSGGWKWRIKSLPQQIDAWYGDHFGFRSVLLNADSLLNVKWLGVSQRAIIGKNGWLFLKMDPPLFTQSLSGAELAKWKSYLEHRQQWLAARGIKYLFVVPPDKDSIYPEFLPDTSKQPPAELPVDQLVRYLAETHSSVNILSLREPLLAAKALEKDTLYYKQDTHWNTLGGFHGYEAIIRQLAKWLPALKEKSRADYRVEYSREARDIAQLAGLPGYTSLNGPVLQLLNPDPAHGRTFPVPGYSTQPFVTQLQNRDDLPRAVVMGDSFLEALAPYLSDSFSRVTYFWTPPNQQELEKTIAGTISGNKPDVFIEERIQRFLPAVPDERIMFGGAEASASGAKKP